MPTPKRQRQKEGRRVRREAQRKREKRRLALRRTATAVVGAAVVVGVVFLVISGPSGGKPASTTTTSGVPTTAAQAAAAQAAADKLAYDAGCSYQLPDKAHPANRLRWSKPPTVKLDKDRTYYATMVTTLGTMRIWLNTLAAPVNTGNFIFLAEHRYYDCNAFFRVQSTYAVQAGSPDSTESSTPGYVIHTEEYPTAVSNPRSIEYPKGQVVMIPVGSTHTNGSQFAIVPQPLPLVASGSSFTIVGYVLGGRSVFATLAEEGNANKSGIPPLVTNRILSVTISSVPGKPVSPTGSEP